MIVASLLELSSNSLKYLICSKSMRSSFNYLLRKKRKMLNQNQVWRNINWPTLLQLDLLTNIRWSTKCSLISLNNLSGNKPSGLFFQPKIFTSSTLKSFTMWSITSLTSPKKVLWFFINYWLPLKIVYITKVSKEFHQFFTFLVVSVSKIIQSIKRRPGERWSSKEDCLSSWYKNQR